MSEYEALLDDLRTTFGKGLINATEVAQYFGIDRRTAAKWYKIPRGGIPIAVLATRAIKKAAG